MFQGLESTLFGYYDTVHNSLDLLMSRLIQFCGHYYSLEEHEILFGLLAPSSLSSFPTDSSFSISDSQSQRSPSSTTTTSTTFKNGQNIIKLKSTGPFKNTMASYTDNWVICQSGLPESGKTLTTTLRPVIHSRVKEGDIFKFLKTIQLAPKKEFIRKGWIFYPNEQVSIKLYQLYMLDIPFDRSSTKLISQESFWILELIGQDDHDEKETMIEKSVQYFAFLINE